MYFRISCNRKKNKTEKKNYIYIMNIYCQFGQIFLSNYQQKTHCFSNKIYPSQGFEHFRLLDVTANEPCMGNHQQKDGEKTEQTFIFHCTSYHKMWSMRGKALLPSISLEITVHTAIITGALRSHNRLSSQQLKRHLQILLFLIVSICKCKCSNRL